MPFEPLLARAALAALLLAPWPALCNVETGTAVQAEPAGAAIAGPLLVVPDFPPVEAPADDEAWLDTVAGPRAVSPGLATRGDWQFEGELQDGLPNGRGKVRHAKNGTLHEGRLIGVRDGRQVTWLWTSPVLTTTPVAGPHGYGTRHVTVLRGETWSVAWRAPSPSALRAQAPVASAVPAPALPAALPMLPMLPVLPAPASGCARPAMVPAHFVTWKQDCHEGRLHGNAQYFSPDLQHDFRLYALRGEAVRGTLTMQHGREAWTGVRWTGGLRLQGDGEVQVAPAGALADALADWRGKRGPWRAPAYVGPVVDGRAEGEGLCGATYDACRHAAGRLLGEGPAWDLPALPDIEQVEAGTRELFEAGWQADAEAEVDTDGLRSSTLSFLFRAMVSGGDCSKVERRGVVEVEDGGQVRATGFKRYRGGWGPCGPSGWGVIDYANGHQYAGQVRGGGDEAPVAFPEGLGVWRYPNGTRHLVRTSGNQRQNLVAYNEGQGWWVTGRFDAKWNTDDGVRRMPGGTRFRGPLNDGQPAGRGIWHNATRTLRVLGEMKVVEGVTRFIGPVEVVLERSVGLQTSAPRPAGRYLAEGSRLSLDAVTLGALEPAPETLAGMARGECRVDLPLPAGWLRDWSVCRAGQWLQLAYSPDRRYRIESHQPDQWSQMLERDGPQNLSVVRTWLTSDGFVLGEPPEPQGTVTYHHNRSKPATHFRGKLVRLEPDGLGTCERPTPETGEEPCEFRMGQRVDQLHLLRQQRLALEAKQRQLEQQRMATQQRQEAERREQAAAQRRAQEAAEARAERARQRADENAGPSFAQAFASAMGQVSADMARQNAQRQRELNALTLSNQQALASQQQARERAAQQATEDSRRNRQELTAQQNLERQQAAARADLNRRMAEAEREQAAERARLASQTAAMNRQLANPSGGYVSPFEAGAARAPAVSGNGSGAGNSADYFESPEGVVICELHEGGRFSCTTTLGSTITGGPSQASGWRTPQEAVAYVGGCRIPRRITWKAGHEVFGCGSGITGMSNYIDVADRLGVTVPGRNTYWCKRLEINCTRTSRP